MSSAATDARAPGPVARVLGDARVSVAEMDPRLVSPEAELLPEEQTCVENAVLSRRQQFAAGRRLARQAWRGLGQPPTALLNDSQRVPLWPPGIIGSITHTQIWCAAAVGKTSEVSALGADVELATPLEQNLWDRVCRPEERAFLRALEPHAAGLLGKAIFSAKESIYKALYPNVRVFLDFQGMRIELEPRIGNGNGIGNGIGIGSWIWHATLMVAWGSWAPGHVFAPGALEVGADLIASAVAW